MDPDIKQLLQENLKLSRDNNEILLKLYRIQRWAQITRVVYWFLIIGISVGAFYFIKPFLNNITNLYIGGVPGINNIGEMTKSLADKEHLQNLLELLNE